MLQLYIFSNNTIKRVTGQDITRQQIEDAIWIDLQNPTEAEEQQIETTLGFDVPTRDESADIEDSARFYENQNALFMTASVVAKIRKQPRRSTATFVLTKKHLITVRYDDNLSLKAFDQNCSRKSDLYSSSDFLFTSLVDQIVQDIAGSLESVTADMDIIVTDLFAKGSVTETPKPDQPKPNLQAIVERLGHHTAALAKLRESLLSLNRLLIFLQKSDTSWLQDKTRAKLESLDRDVKSLTEYESHLISEVGYMQTAAFNLITFEQNQIIKVFSVVAVLFLPPTLVGTIYGMNFQNMPELKWEYGYPLALVMMVMSAALPFYWFKRKGWL